MIIATLLLLPLLHYIADFECQTDWMALGKSKRLLPLLTHVGIYSAWFLVAFGWQFGAITFASHFLVDFFTSRWTSKLWAQEKRHRFFCVIGLDQMIHSYCLLLTALFLMPVPFWWLL